ncbi:MAG: hypothetical protein KY475_00635 [Planctomycetes bacterium]|nr:hypothetical protein [Planctomycetota bacterium]
MPLFDRPKLRTIAAFGAGLALGLAVAAGVMIGQMQSASEMTLAERFLEETELHATGASGGKSLAIATGVIDEGTEGVFLLDFLTGDLQCWVINPRAGRFTNMFKYNVIADLGVEQGKTPDYVMTTGVADFRGPAGSAVGRSLVYVADGNTGNVGCYAVPWNRQLAANMSVQMGALQPVAVGKARAVAIQE